MTEGEKRRIAKETGPVPKDVPVDQVINEKVNEADKSIREQQKKTLAVARWSFSAAGPLAAGRRSALHQRIFAGFSALRAYPGLPFGVLRGGPLLALGGDAGIVPGRQARGGWRGFARDVASREFAGHTKSDCKIRVRSPQ